METLEEKPSPLVFELHSFWAIKNLHGIKAGFGLSPLPGLHPPKPHLHLAFSYWFSYLTRHLTLGSTVHIMGPDLLGGHDTNLEGYDLL